MALTLVGEIALPPHTRSGGFDHAAVHRGTGRLYVAHPANDAIDIVDCAAQRYTGSIAGLPGVAGALVSEERDLVFTSNRAENTVGIFRPDNETTVTKVSVGVRPNGLAYDVGRNRLLAANVGDPAVPGSCTVTIVDVGTSAVLAHVPMAGRTRWAVFDPQASVFYVNIADPAQIAVVDASGPPRLRRSIAIPTAGPHGLDLDVRARRLFCACDGGQLVEVHADSGEIGRRVDIGGVPDVIFFNAALERLYVAIGDPGIIEVWNTSTMRRLQVVETEKGAHTLAFDARSNTIYAFLPHSHRATVYVDRD
jgi:DNA-binding beta-propeller fold protein YncE